MIREDATLIRGLGEIAQAEGAEAFWPPPMLLWRNREWVDGLPKTKEVGFRVAYFTKFVAERKRFLCWDDLDKSFPEKFEGEVSDAFTGAYDAFKHGAAVVELRPLEELNR